ncbi:MAG TPA: IS630 family transposase [Synechococcus sp. UBA8638]|nr:IS630 family transposase [Synechococcus sp. UBA8638]
MAEALNTALQSPPAHATHWSVRTLAQHPGISKSTVHRWFQLFNLRPHRHRHFKISNDPYFVKKVHDIVGLYLRLPDDAVVLCVDEKMQIQVPERTQPMPPLGLGYVEDVTHETIRDGVTTLFAVLDVATGKVLAQCKHRHRRQEFVSFLQHIERNVPNNLDIHLIIDNYCTHKHAKVKE